MSRSNDKVTHRVSSTLISAILAVSINYLITFALTPYITNHIGTEAYGFVSLAKTISSYGIVITACLNAYAARYIALAYHDNDVKKASTYFSSVVLANLFILIIVAFCATLFIWKLQIFINIPTGLLLDVKLLFFFDIINYICLALSNTFTASAYIKNRLDLVEKIKVIVYIVEAIMLIALFGLLTPHIYYVGIALIISTIVLGGLNYYLYKRLTPELLVESSSFSWSAVKDLVFSGVWNSLNSIGNMLNSGLDLWVSNIMLSTLAMGQLSIVKTLAAVFSTLIGLVSRPFQPYLLQKYAKNDKKGLFSILNFEIKFSGYITGMLFAGLLTYGTTYFRLWTPKQDITLLQGITIVTIIGFLFEGMVQPLFYSYTLTLKNRVPCIVTIMSGLLNVLGMYVLLKNTDLGLYAVVGTTTVIGFFTFFIFTPLYSAKCLEMKWYVFYPSMIKILGATFLVTVLMKTLAMVYMPNSWSTLIGIALMDCIVGLIIYVFCVFTPKEYTRCINVLLTKENAK